MSASSAVARSANRARLDSVRIVASEPISESRCPPMRPSASCSSIASRSPHPSSSMSLVIAARPGRSARIRRRPDRQQREKADERHGVMLDGPDPQAVGERAAANLRKAERRIGTERRKPGAIDGHQDDRHRPRIRRGQLGASFRDHAQEHAALGPQPVARGALHGRWRDTAISIEIAIEEAGIAEEDVVRVQLIGLCRRTRRPSAADR